MSNKLDLNIKKILQDWSISDALREVVANAYDESKLSNTNEPIIKYDELKKELSIIDFGRGLKEDHFVQNENKEKTESKIVIGKFGIGLKDAISVLYRNNKEIIFSSSFGTFMPIEDYKKGISTKIKTIHVDYNHTLSIPVGTSIIVKDISITDYQDTQSNFLKLSPLKLISKSSKGEIYFLKDISCIFMNGMKISTDDNFAFSYNILEVNAKLKKSLNRERKMVSRDAFRDNVISILKSSISPNEQNLINLILESKDKFPNGEWSFIDIKKAIIKNTNQKILFACQELNTNAAYQSYAEDKGYSLIWVNSSDYKNIKNDKEVIEFTLDYFGNDFINNYEGIAIDDNDLLDIQKENWKWAINKVKDLSIIWPEWNKHYNKIELKIIKEHPNASGIAFSNKIEIVSKIINNKKELFNTIIHEICHVVSNFASDGSLEFEHTLTSAYYYVLNLSNNSN